MVIYGWFTYKRWGFPIAMLVYKRVRIQFFRSSSWPIPSWRWPIRSLVCTALPPMGTRVTCVNLVGFEELKKISCKVLLELNFLALQVQAWFRVFLQPLDLLCCPSSYTNDTNRLQFILRSSSNCCELLTIQHLQCFLPLRLHLRRLRPHPAVMEDQNTTMRMKKQYVY